MSKFGTRVCVIGLGHLGCIYAACLAKLRYNVVGTDEDQKIVDDLKKGQPPIFEPGLHELIAEGKAAGNLRFAHEIREAARDAGFVIVAYDTPVSVEDTVDISVVLRAVDQLKEAAIHATILVSSQVPVGTCERIARMVSDAGKSSVAYVPENLRLGQAIECFMNPDMIVIGANNPSTTARVRRLFAPIQTKILEMDLTSAEMTKHSLNAFLATSISYANEIGNICDLVGADALKIAEALKSDSRIGPRALLRPGLGFAGGTLARDLRILQEIGRNQGYETLLLDGVFAVNRRQNASVVDRIERLVGKLEGKVVGVLGLTYKARTSTLRRSAALELIQDLRSRGATVKAYDSIVTKTNLATEDFQFCDDPYDAAKETDALVIMNDSLDFSRLDFKRIRRLMKAPVVLDTQNILDPSKMLEAGFKYRGIGRGWRATQ